MATEDSGFDCCGVFGTTGSFWDYLFLRAGTTPILGKKTPRMEGQMKILHVGSHQFRESLRELLRELWFSYCSSRGFVFREWNVVFREWNCEFRELLREYPGTLPELREWSPCRKRSPAKGVWQKSDEKSDRSIRKSDRKVTKSVPKTKKKLSNSFCRTPFAAPWNGLFTPRAFFLKWGWSSGFWVVWASERGIRHISALPSWRYVGRCAPLAVRHAQIHRVSCWEKWRSAWFVWGAPALCA